MSPGHPGIYGWPLIAPSHIWPAESIFLVPPLEVIIKQERLSSLQLNHCVERKMRPFKPNVRHWGNLHAPVASGGPTSTEGKALSPFQVFDCKSLWRIKIQCCGLTRNHTTVFALFFFLCAHLCLCSSLFESGAGGGW